ncbi:MAG: hypothetical protein GXY55_01375 [Phycisphaerae bacterium]|nr:hypothetical protein [Phycisphaerae bacterium]
MQRRTRNKICIWVIFGGLINFLTYTVIYWELGGDAKNGWKEVIRDGDHKIGSRYHIQGHFIHGSGVGRSAEVPRWVWIYSYLHSISLWPTQGAMVICMLILARPHIIATMSESTWIRGPTFITVVITLTAVLCSVLTLLFTIHFIRDLCA